MSNLGLLVLLGRSHLKPRQTHSFGSFDERTRVHAGQHTCLTLTVSPLTIYICCFGETHNRGSTSVVKLPAPIFSSRYLLRTLGGEAAEVVGRCKVGIVLPSMGLFLNVMRQFACLHDLTSHTRWPISSRRSIRVWKSNGQRCIKMVFCSSGFIWSGNSIGYLNERIMDPNR